MAGPARPADEAPELAATLLAHLETDGWTLAVAESCTGGLLGGTITSVPGSSAAFLGGVIAYNDGAKVAHLGVDERLLHDGHGAVSAAVAEAMAHGVRDKFGADLAISVSGIAGPGGGSKRKPVGMVWIAVAGPGKRLNVHRIQVPGDRETVRRATVVEALKLALGNLGEAESSFAVPARPGK